MSKPIVPYWILALMVAMTISAVIAMVRRRSRPSRVASKIYGLIVTAARRPALYAHAGVADTPEGRFEAITLYTVLVLERLLREGAAGAGLARALVEALITDMDDQMREMGVGDQSVPKKVQKAAAAVYDRLAAYRPALAAGDAGALDELFNNAGLLPKSNVHSTTATAVHTTLAAHALAVRTALDATESRALLDGAINFPEYC